MQLKIPSLSQEWKKKEKNKKTKKTKKTKTKQKTDGTTCSCQ